ncbi:hypothetical protein WME95_12905 [Sorangium sp. So ce327]
MKHVGPDRSTGGTRCLHVGGAPERGAPHLDLIVTARSVAWHTTG